MGDGTIVDSMIHDGLWDSFNNIHMGLTGELVSEKYHVTREEQDAYAVESHRKRRARDARGLVQGRDPADLDSAEEGRSRSSSIATSRSARTRRWSRSPS